MKDNVKRVLNHLSSIFFRMSILSMIVLCAFFVSKIMNGVIEAFGFILLIFSVIFTFGLVFIIPGGIDYLHSIIEFVDPTNLEKLGETINSYIPAATIITGVLLALTLVGFIVNYKKQGVRLYITGAMTIGYIVVAITLNILKAGV